MNATVDRYTNIDKPNADSDSVTKNLFFSEYPEK